MWIMTFNPQAFAFTPGANKHSHYLDSACTVISICKLLVNKHGATQVKGSYGQVSFRLNHFL